MKPLKITDPEFQHQMEAARDAILMALHKFELNTGRTVTTAELRTLETTTLCDDSPQYVRDVHIAVAPLPGTLLDDA